MNNPRALRLPLEVRMRQSLGEQVAVALPHGLCSNVIEQLPWQALPRSPCPQISSPDANKH